MFTEPSLWPPNGKELRYWTGEYQFLQLFEIYYGTYVLIYTKSTTLIKITMLPTL